MPKKTYKFPGTDGQDIEKNLAKPTNDRIERFLRALGKKSFTELLSSEGQLAYGAKILDLAINKEGLRKMLDISLAEGSEGINLDGIDMTITDEVIQDFFEQRSKTFIARLQK